MQAVEKAKTKRAHLRASITRLATKLDTVLSVDIEQTNHEELEEILEHFLEKGELLKVLNGEIEEHLKDVKEFEQEIASNEKYDEIIISSKFKIKNRLKNLNRKDTSSLISDTNSSTLNSSSNVVEMTPTASIKLPKLKIETYSGDSSMWLEFFNTFQTSIDQNKHLTKIEKFAYLKSLLSGQAYNVVKGFPLTEDSYDSCLELLKERFGKTSVIINAHMSKLLNLEPVKNSSNLKALRKLHDECEINIRSLQNLGVASGSYGHLLNPILLKLLPQDLVLEFHRTRDPKKDSDITDLIAFLKNEIECREVAVLVSNSSSDKKASYDNRAPDYRKQTPWFGKNVAAAATLNTSLRLPAKPFCIFCKMDNDHESLKCETLTNDLKRLRLKKEGRCYKCFRKNHVSALCRSKIKNCSLCEGQNHNELFCKLNKNPNEKAKEISKNETVLSLSQSENMKVSNTTLLQTCTVSVESSGKSELVRCLIDTGSERTFLKREIAEALKLIPIRKEKLMIFCFGQRKPREIDYDVVSVELQSIYDSNCLKIEALVTDVITSSEVRTAPPDIRKLLHSKGFRVCNVLGKQEVQVLLGADYAWKIMKGEVKQLSDGLFICETLFGHTVQGQIHSLPSEENCITGVNVMSISVETLNEEIKKFWSLESLGIVSEKKNDVTDDFCIREFENNLCFSEGRYQTKLLWKANKNKLNDNFNITKNRFESLRNKLNRNDWLFENYNSIIKEQLEDGVIELCEDKDPCNNSYYMPHRPVIRNDKTTSRIRIVYDASSKQPDFNSLNDCLESGTNLNPNILDMIVKFREKRIAFSADIEKAFLQIGIVNEDRDYLRFLYFADCDRDKNVTSYRMTRVPFGVTCSPFILACTIKHHIRKYEGTNYETVNMLDTSLYVDDLIFSSDSVDKAFSLSTEAVTILKEAGMKLRKFETNSMELKERWQNYDVSLVTQGKSEKPLKVLGINWNTSEDLFGLDIQSLLLTLESYKNTKRNVLQVAAKCYDPAGFVSPFIIRVKCLLQEIWKLGLSWDENFEGETLKKWNEWCSEVQFLKQFSVPRYYFSCSNKVVHESIQLHVFSDASLHAYGAVAYFRYNDEQHGIKTSFVLSKSRVAPVKKLTLPRLELMGALIASRIGNYLKNLFSIQNIIYWTDSTITLFWIKGCATKWKQFVSNRVAEIQELTNPQNWRHCDGKSNPADLVSRGCSASELISNKIWLEGPVWLSKLENQWPKLKVKENNFDDLAEERNIKKTALVNVMNIEDRVFGVLTKISSWTKLQRIVAWCLRFIANSKLASNWKKGCLTVDEIRRASDVILKKIQRNEFAEEIKCLEVGKPVSSHSRLISLNPFLDKNNVMRVGGRLNNAEISETSKHPIIMPKKNFVTNLIIQYYHLKHLHGGVQLLLSAIRQEYWIISAKTEIKKCIWKCVKCCRFRGTTATQLMGDLPSTRVVPSKVFSKTGVDFTGPFLVKMKRGRGIRPNKCYVCLFVCFATKACHLELVGDLSSEAFIAALKRFAARRGKPQLIYSDCGTNFVGVNKIIRNAIASLKSNPQFRNWISSEGIEWNFNSPAAPHHGGLWEAGVKSMKHHLRRSVGPQILTYEEFLTLIIQVEACLNSRPITPVSSDPGDLNALTPGHFLTGGPLTAVPEHDLTEQKVTPRERWKLTQQMSQSFWKCWSREYLCELQQRHKWRYSNQNIRINDLVILKEDNQPPRYWKLARVTKLYPGTDSRVRVVKLKTVNGELKRPVTKLCILPIDD